MHNTSLPLPPFIENQPDKNGWDHFFNCQAWWLLTSKSSRKAINDWIDKKGNAHNKLKNRFNRCIAWKWLNTTSLENIQEKIDSLPPEISLEMEGYIDELKDKVPAHA